MRIVHLIEGQSPQATPTTLAMLATAMGRLGSIEQHVLLLGGAALRRAAARAGLHVDRRNVHLMGVPFGRAMLGWPAVMRRLRQWQPIDVVHCWSAGSLSLAALALREVPRVMTVTSEPDERTTHWFRTLSREVTRIDGAATAFLPISATLRRALLTRGVAEEAVQVLRPGIDMGRIDTSQRAALRKRWGIPPADDQRTKVIALLSDRPEEADAVRTALMAGIAEEVTGPLEWRVAMHPGARHRLRAQHMLGKTRGPDRIISEPAMTAPWSVLSGCDVALACGNAGGGLSLLWAMAANIPIVGEATYAISEIVEDRHSALLSKPDVIKETVKRLTRVVGDPQLAWKLRDTARHEAYSFFSRQRYCQSLQQVYEQLSQGSPIHVPDLEPTGGLRFTGRA